MTLIVHNSNPLPFNITSINVLAYQGQVHIQAAYRQNINGTEGSVPAGGSAEILLEDKIGLMGRCDLQINMVGSLGPDTVGGTFYSSTVVMPAERPTALGLEPLTLAAVIASVVVIAALVVYLVKRRS
ncbi:MAG: hypothetical protein ISF22_02780 [Methanomassiliicoccus sp.]|nr:hypothetical protein [Methanomassiliicoccus sp.]